MAQLADSDLQLEPVIPEDLLRMAELVSTYADLPLGVVDASVVAVAERLNAIEVATPSIIGTSVSCVPATPQRSPCCPDPGIASSSLRERAT